MPVFTAQETNLLYSEEVISTALIKKNAKR